MANSDKNIRITTSKNKTTYPNIVFTGSAAGSSVITLEVLDDNTLSFTSNEGQVFSIDSNLSTGTIWAVSDISGIPLLSASAGGTVGLGVYGGLVAIGQTNPIYKLDLKGSFGLASSNDSVYNFIFSNSAASGSNSLQIRSANSLLLYNSGNTFYTGFKSNAATNITYTLPTTDGSSGQFLQTNGSAVLTWATATGSGGTGSTAGVGQGGQYEMAYYPGTGLSVIGSNTFTNNTVTGVVSITHSTVSTDSSTGAFKVTGGVGIGGSLYVGGIGASITGVTFSNSTITRGTWNGTNISTTYGGTGQNLGSSSGVLTISSGTVSASTTSSAIASALSDETGSGSLVFNSQPSFGTGVTTGDATFAVFNTNATTINAFGAATAISLGAATGKATFNSTDNSISSTTGGLVVSGGAGFAKSISVAGRLQLLNGANVTAFVSSGTGNTLYTLPATSPATGSSVLQSTAEGVMSWVPMVASSSGAGSGTVAVPNAQHAVAYYAGTGASVSGSNTFTNNTATGIVNITHSTVSTTSATGALVVSGGVGIGGSIFSSTSVPSSISGVVLNNGIVTIGTWSGNFITSLYGGTGFNSYTIGDILVASTGTSLAKLPAGATNFVLTSNGTGTVPSWQAVPASAASSVAVSSTLVDAVFYPTVINSVSGSGLGLSTVNTIQINPARGTFAAVGISAGTAITVVGTAAAINTNTGALQAIGGVGIGGSLYVAGASRFSSSIAAISNGTGALTVTGGAGIGGSLYVGDASRFESNINSTTPGVGGLIATGGVGIGLSASIGGRLQMFNSSLYTAFVGAQSGVNTTYTLPTTSPATGSSVLQSTAGGVMSWVPMTSGGSASPGGVVDGSVQFKSGSSFGGTRGLYWNDLNKYLQVTGYAGGEPYVSSQAALLIEQSYGSFNGSGNGNIIGANAVSGFTGSLIDLQLNAVTRFRVASTGAVTFANAFTFPTTDGSPNQVLQTNGSGSVSWATVTGSSGAGSGTVAIPGAQYQVAAYYHSATGASVSGSTTFTNNTSTGVVNITHATESTSSTTGAITITGGAGIAKSLFVGTTLSVGQAPGYNVTNNLASFVSTVNTYNQVVIQNKSNGAAASADFVLNNDSSTDATFYGNFGMNSSAFTGSGALNAPNAVYVAAHTAPLVIGTLTSHPIRFTVNNGATDTIYIHEAGTAISVFTNLDLRSQNDIRFFNSGNTFNTALQAGSNTVNYTLSLPTAPVGAGSSVIVTGSDGQMYYAAPGSGIAFSSATANTPIIRAKRPIALQFSAGYTPAAAGADTVILRVPESATDGTTALTYNLRRFQVRVETPSAGSSRLQLERSSTDTGAFTLAATGSSHIGGLGVTIVGAGIYLTSVTTFSGSLVTSGNLLRLNWTLLNATHASFSVQLLLEEV